MAHGFLYLTAILDVFSRKVLVWQLSNTMTADFCVEALEEAIARFAAPEIFNTDQGSQFTSDDWTRVLKNAGVAISMDGKGRWIDNVFIGRLWRSVKNEEVYLHAYAGGTEARKGLTTYFSFYNTHRSHQGLDYRTPDEVYFTALATAVAQAAWAMSALTAARASAACGGGLRGGVRFANRTKIRIINPPGRHTYLARSSAASRSLPAKAFITPSRTSGPNEASSYTRARIATRTRRASRRSGRWR